MLTHWERLLIAVASLTLPRGGREWMTGDVEEHYADIRAERGAILAGWWLAGESLRNVRDRISDLSWERAAMHTIGRRSRRTRSSCEPRRRVRRSPAYGRCCTTWIRPARFMTPRQ